ncbi:MAG: hypothetical protein RDV48_06105 [Candidatus Eremiobacteraeota bacterium]|nr:hypothetical protein [Candidatus Eremiobacteraeota bacterium]
MKKLAILLLITIALTGLMALKSLPCRAQLIMVNLRVKIVKVERQNNRLQVRVHEGGNKDIQYIDIDGNTKFSIDHREVSFDAAWKYFRKDMIIRVKGGYTMGLHVKAKQIWM